MNLTNKVSIVTGAGSGMGRQLAIQLAEKGARVVAIDYNPDSLAETMSLLGGASSHHLDISLNVADSEKVIESVERIIEVYGTIDVLINNAGIVHPFIPVSELTLEQIHRVFDVNWLGVVYMTKACLPHLLKSNHAHLVNISSVGAFASIPTQVIYNASKAAINMFTQGLMSELHDTNVGITVVYPGAIKTNITQNAPDMSESQKETLLESQKEFVEKHATTAHDAASQMLRAIETGQQRLFIGKDAKFLNFVNRISPRLTSNLLRLMLKKALPAE